MRAAVLRDGRMVCREVGLTGVAAAFDELASPGAHCKVLVTP
jgi:hypothetical protein